MVPTRCVVDERIQIAVTVIRVCELETTTLFQKVTGLLTKSQGAAPSTYPTIGLDGLTASSDQVHMSDVGSYVDIETVSTA